MLLPFDKLRINFIFDEGRSVVWQELPSTYDTPASAGERLRNFAGARALLGRLQRLLIGQRM